MKTRSRKVVLITLTFKLSKNVRKSDFFIRRLIMTKKEDGRKKDRKIMEHIRLNAIDRWLAGERPLDIIRSIGYCETTIYKWIDTYFEFGREGLLSTKAAGAPSKLCDSQKNQVKEMIVGKEPKFHGLDASLWTRQIVADLIKKKFDVTLGLTQVGVLLADLGITPQKPTRHAREQDPVKVKEWEEEKFPAIFKAAQETNAELFFWDEAGYRLDDQVGRTWGAKGETPVVQVTGKRDRTNSAIAMSINGAFWFNEFDGNLNSEKFCDLLDEFMKTRSRKVVLIMDGHPTHDSKFTQEHLKRYEGKLVIHPLPGYSPELNPVEYVNHYVKENGPRKFLAYTKSELSQIVQNVLQPLKGAFKKVRSFFNHESLKYIRI
jgi:transposase